MTNVWKDENEGSTYEAELSIECPLVGGRPLIGVHRPRGGQNLVFVPKDWQQAHEIADAIKAAWPRPEYEVAFMGDWTDVVRVGTGPVARFSHFGHPGAEAAARAEADRLNRQATGEGGA